MGTEYELKYALPDSTFPDAIAGCKAVMALLDGPEEQLTMRTDYYDTPDGFLNARRWTLRRRMENGRSVCCCKTPIAGTRARGEWETEAPSLADGIPGLTELGAPAELLTLTGLRSVCAAAFTRRAIPLRFPDGSRCELALDVGELRGPTEAMPLYELELELKEGSAGQMETLAGQLAARFRLEPQPLSKQARARSLR